MRRGRRGQREGRAEGGERAAHHQRPRGQGRNSHADRQCEKPTTGRDARKDRMSFRMKEVMEVTDADCGGIAHRLI
jgi:hypothetical protein